MFTDQDYPCEFEQQSASFSESNPLEIALHVDGSGSMLGYVDNPNSRYIRTLKLLDSVFHLDNGPRDEQTLTHYRSGGRDNQLISRQQYRNAFDPDFYTGANPNFPKVSSHLDKAITPPEEQNEKLLVFVTDLEQNGADVNNVIKKIEETYLKNNQSNYSVGILGVKSEFRGTVYSTDPRVSSDFYYDTTDKSAIEEYRPFYVVFIGPYSDLIYYYQALKRKSSDLIETSEFVIFSPNQFMKEPSYPRLTDNLPNEVSSPQYLQIGRVGFESNHSSYTLLEVPGRIDQQAISIPFSLDFSLLDHTLPPDPEGIKAEKSLQLSDSFEKKFVKQDNNSPLKQALNITDVNLTDNTLTFNTKVKPESLTESGIYLFTLDLKIDNLQGASWWEDWDWENRSDNQDGSKTYNFFNFMTNMKNLMTDGNKKPSINRFCYAIQKN
ncbi:hypothetical protein [Crocosphaera sp. Alani8]|uniref:hypothetical protein n=1 Tax=Crocosphaera sp. Alani8 TaxID=3038952 RepID=UPI00313BAE82